MRAPVPHRVEKHDAAGRVTLYRGNRGLALGFFKTLAAPPLGVEYVLIHERSGQVVRRRIGKATGAGRVVEGPPHRT